MTITLNGRIIRINWLSVCYFAVIATFVLYTFHDLAYNTAFVDEAIYATVGEETLRGITWENALSWMGGSYFYPIVSALINRYLGLTGVRFFSTLCLLITGIIAGKIGKTLGGKKTEVLSLFLFLFSSISLDLAQMGTYDSLCLVLLALSFYLSTFSNLPSVLTSAITFAFSVLAKYFAIAFLLPILLSVYLKAGTLTKRKMVLWLLVLGTILGLYFARYHTEVYSYLSGSYSNQPSTPTEISKQILNTLNISIIGAISALFFANKYLIKNVPRKFVFVIFTGGLMPILYHLGAGNVRSLWKHLVFTSFFWVPLTAYSLGKILNLVKRAQKKKVILANLSQLTLTLFLLSIVTSIWFSFSRHWRFQRSWPSASGVLDYLKNNRESDDKIFAEGSAIYKYHLFDGFNDPSSWSSTWYLEYEGDVGVSAMKAAINNKAFDFIILNNYFTPYVNKDILPTIHDKYKVAFSSTYKVSGDYDEVTTVWEPR